MIVPLEKPGTPEELVHFGVKGMQWGVRRQVEKVAGEGTKTGKYISKKKEQRVEKKEQRVKGHEAEAARTQATIDHLKANPSPVFFVQHHRNAQIKELEKYRDQRLKDAKDIREGHLTDRQKHILIGAGVAAGLLAAYGTYKFIDSGTAQQILSKDIPFKKNDLLTRKMSTPAIMRDVVHPINPDYGKLGTKMNCRRCTFAYEMRRRGYDVKSTNSVSGTGQTVAGVLNATNPESNLHTGKLAMIRGVLQKGSPIHEAVQTGHGMGKEAVGDFDFPALTPKAKTATIFKAIGKHPEGSRGELGLQWKFLGAHSMAWEVINGKPLIIDTQNGQHYADARFAREVAENIQHAGITRLDNLDLNQKFLGKWVRNVK